MKENVAKEKKLANFFAFSLKDVLKDGYFLEKKVNIWL